MWGGGNAPPFFIVFMMSGLITVPKFLEGAVVILRPRWKGLLLFQGRGVMRHNYIQAA